MKALEITGLKKSYGQHAVLRGVSLCVGGGETVALLGANGAGKTTLLECAEGLRKPDAGRVTVRGRAGVQLQRAALPGALRAMEAVTLCAKWKRAPVDSSLLCALGVTEFAKSPCAALSTGQQRRLHLAMALTGSPGLLFLDEPTAGLDPQGRAALHELLQKLRAAGTAILLASHDMAEVSALCTRIAVLHQGRIVFCGAPQELSKRLGARHRVVIRCGEKERRFETADVGRDLAQALLDCRASGLSVTDVQVTRASLEEQVLALTKEG